MAICSISKEERDSLYQMVYNNFYKASMENKPIDVESYMKELVDLISKNAKDQLVTEAYTQILPGIISQAAFINNNVTMHLIKNGFNLNFVTDKMMEFENYDKVQAYLGTGQAAEEVAQEEVKNSLEQSVSGDLPESKEPELPAQFTDIVESIFSTTGMQNLIEGSVKLTDNIPDPAKQFYYDFILHITNNAKDNDFGYNITAVPLRALEELGDQYIYDKPDYTRPAASLMLAVTNEYGDILFFDKEYNVVSKDKGKPIYFPARSGRRTREAIGKKVLTPERIAERRGISVEKAKEIQDAEIAFMSNLYDYTKDNINNPEKWIKMPISGTSLGAIRVNYNVVTPLSRVAFTNQTFNPIVIQEKNFGEQTKTNSVFYINGIQSPIPIISRGMSSDIARKLARLIARPVIEVDEFGNKRELTLDEKNNILSEFIYRPQSGISFLDLKNIGPRLALGGVEINLADQDAAEEAVYRHLFENVYLSDTQVKENEIKNGYLNGKTIINKKDRAWKQKLAENTVVFDGKNYFKVYNRRLHINTRALANTDGLFDNFNIEFKDGEWQKTENKIRYVDYVKENFFINLPLNKNNEIVGLNGYIKFDPASSDFEKILNYKAKDKATPYQKKGKPAVKTNKTKKSATTPKKEAKPAKKETKKATKGEAPSEIITDPKVIKSILNNAIARVEEAAIEYSVTVYIDKVNNFEEALSDLEAAIQASTGEKREELQNIYDDYKDYLEELQGEKPNPVSTVEVINKIITNTPATTKTIPGPETKINIYASTGENAELSNFANRPFIASAAGLDEDEWPAQGKFNTVEGAYQAQKIAYTSKATEEENKFNLEILAKLRTASGAQARSLGRQIKAVDTKDWDADSSTVMKNLLLESFDQNPDALAKLLATGNATLTHTQDKGKWGKEFPKLLMEVREELSSVKNVPTAAVISQTTQGTTDTFDDDEFKGLSRNTKQARDFARQFGLRFDLAKLSKEELQAKLDEAKEWFDNSIFANHFKFEDLMNEVNTYDPSAVAKWFQNSIILFEGANYSDLYHEAFHGFTRMFLTEEQRQELYNKTRKRQGSFRTYKGSYRNFNVASDIELEEFLAEEFRAFMLSGGKMEIQDVTQRNIFRRMLDFLMDLFGVESYSDMILNQDSMLYARDLYTKLQFGRLAEYSYSEQNLPAEISKRALNKGAEAVNDNYSTPVLTMRNSLDLTDTIDSLFSDFINARIGVNDDSSGINPYYTTSILSIPKGREAAYTYAKTKIEEAIIDLDTKIAEAKTDREKTVYLNRQDALVWAIDNWDLDGDKGIISFHKKKSKFSDFVLAAEKAILLFEDDATYKGRDGHDRKSNESSLQDLAHEGVIYLIKSLHAVDSNGKNIENNLGFNALMDFGIAWNRITRTLDGANSPQEMYTRLQDAKEDSPFINELLIKLGNPDVQMDANSQNMWTHFNDAFNKTRVPLVALVIDKTFEKTGEVDVNAATGESRDIYAPVYSAKVGGASIADAKVGRDWSDRFKTVTTTYIKQDAAGNNYLDVESVYNDYVKQYSSLNRLKFLQDIGFYFDNKSKIIGALNKMTPNPAKIFFDRIEAIKLHNDKAIAENKIKNTIVVRNLDTLINPPKFLKQNGESPRGLNGLYKSMQALQAKYRDDYSDFMVLNAAGDAQYEFMENGTITQQVRNLQNAANFNELVAMPEMNHLSSKRNPFVSTDPDPTKKRLVTISELFDFTKPGGEKRSLRQEVGSSEKITIDLNNLAGVSFTVKGEQSNGIAAADADEFTKRLTDFHVNVMYGLPMGTTPADKSTILVYHLSNRKYYVNPREFAQGTKGEVSAFYILLGYLEAELDRINRVKALPENAPERMVPVGKSTYGVTGSKFTIFDDMLRDELKKELMNIPKEYGASLRDYLKLPEAGDLRQRLFNDIIKVYFANKVNEFREKLSEAQYVDQGINQKMQELFAEGDPKARRLKTDETTNMAILTHVYNSFIHNVETVLLYHGDPALYNMAKEEFQKRNAGINSGGIIPRTDAAMMRYLNNHVFAENKASYQKSEWYTGQPVQKMYGDTFKSAVLQDVETKSLYYKAIEDDIRTTIENSPGYKNGKLTDADVDKIVNERAKPYREMKEGDAQGWITFDGYKALSIMMGAWSDSQELLYRDLLAKKNVDPARLKEFFPVLKMQYWGPLATDGLPLTAFHKFSLVPLIPSTIEGSDLEKLHNKLVEQGVDYALFSSGSKVSTITSNGKPDKFYKENGDAQNRELAFTEDGYTFTPNNIFLKYFKKQLEIAPKYKGKVTFPTQLRKLIESGLMSNGVPTDFMMDMPKEVRIAKWAELKTEGDKRKASTNYILLKTFEDNLENLMAQKKQELLDEIGWSYVDGKPTGPLDKLLAYIEKQLTKQDLAEHHLDFIKLTKDNKLQTSLDISLAAEKIEKVLISILNKKLIKQKVAGEALVQVSGAGYTDRAFFDANKDSKNRLSVLGTNDLPFYRKENGITRAMKVKIAIQGEFKKLLDIPKVTEMVEESYRKSAENPAIKPITRLQALNQLIKDDEWLNENDEANRMLITMAGVRIPVQGLNSMEFMEVYEFLPEGGNQIVLPAEIVAKSGGDFDIDKLTIMMPTMTREEDGSVYIKKDYQNAVIDDIINILSLEQNYVDLITPNATDIVQPIAEELAEKVRPYDSMQTVFSGRGSQISPTRIFEIEYNIYKHGSNSIGKKTLGQGAVDNTYNVIFNTAGAYMEPFYIVTKETKGEDGKKKTTETKFSQELYLPHNTLLTPAGQAISLSDIYDADGVNKVSDVISQLINGWVDIAKDPWIFDIQGNNMVAPSLLFMVQAGVPIKQAAYFASQPIIRQYINEVKKAKSAYAGPLGIELANPNYFRTEARKKLLTQFPQMDQFVEETDQGSKYFTNKGMADAMETLSRPFKDKIFNQKYFADHLQDEISFDSDEQLALLLHFMDIENMSKVITAVKSTTNFDTNVSNSLFQTNLKTFQADQLREDNRLGKDVINRILDESSISSFGIADFMNEVYKNLFTIRDSKVVNDYLFDFIKEGNLQFAVDGTFGDAEQYIATFRNDLMMFLFQNYMRNLDFDSVPYYKSLEVAKAPITLKPTIASPVSVFVKEVKLSRGGTKPIMYFDKTKLMEEFENLKTNTGKQGINITNPDLDFEFGTLRANFFQNVREYGRFVMERELLRYAVPTSEMMKRGDFIQYKKDYINQYLDTVDEEALEEKATLFAYETTLRDMALDNTYNQYYILKSPTRSYAQRLLNIKEKFPSLMDKYKVLDFMTADEAKTKERVIKFKSGKLDVDRMNRFHEDLVELADPYNLMENANMTEFEAIETAKFFSNLPIYTMFTTGFNSKGEYGIGQIMPDTRLTPILDSMINYMSKYKLLTPDLLKGYTRQFGVVNSMNNSSSRYKVKNYTLDEPLWKASKSPKIDLTGAYGEEIRTFRDNYKNPSYSLAVKPDVDLTKAIDNLLKSRYKYLFVFNGAASPTAKPLKSNDSAFALANKTNVFALTSKIGFIDVVSQQMNDDNYDDNIAAIEESIQALVETAKDYDNKIFWNAAGYGQGMIGADINGQNLDQKKAKAPKTFVYLSKRLYEEFGYKNKNYEVVAPKKFIRVTKSEVLENIRKCLS